jgi:hypothetical protein
LSYCGFPQPTDIDCGKYFKLELPRVELSTRGGFFWLLTAQTKFTVAVFRQLPERDARVNAARNAALMHALAAQT